MMSEVVDVLVSERAYVLKQLEQEEERYKPLARKAELASNAMMKSYARKKDLLEDLDKLNKAIQALGVEIPT